MTTTAPAQPSCIQSTGLRRAFVPMAVGLSLTLHVAAFMGVLGAPRSRPAVHPPIDIEVVTSPPPPAAAAPVAPVPTPQAPIPKAKRTPSPKMPVVTPPQAPPSPQHKTSAPAPMHIGVSLSSTTPGQGMAVPVGDTLAGAAPERAANPNDAASSGPGTSVGVVQSFQLDEAPAVEHEPDLRAYYPPEAIKEAMEGQVVLALDIDAAGKVIRATVTKSAGHGFDAAAVRAALEQLHFKPAQKGGHAVATHIAYTLTFLLD